MDLYKKAAPDSYNQFKMENLIPVSKEVTMQYIYGRLTKSKKLVSGIAIEWQ